MTQDRFDVMSYMLRRGGEWQERLTVDELDGILVRLESRELGVREGGAPAVADILSGRFHDDGIMHKVLLETMGRYGSFSEIMEDARLRDGNVTLGRNVVDTARDHYNTALAMRFCFKPESGDLVVASSPEALEARRRQWTESMPDRQLEEIHSRMDMTVRPRDVVSLLPEQYSRPELLDQLVKQSAQEMRSFASFLQELREWGDLDHLEPSQAAGIRRSYNALVAQGWGVDVRAELLSRREKRSGTVTPESVTSVLTGRYEHPAIIGEELIRSLGLGQEFKEFLADLRGFGELDHLTGAEYQDLRRDYDALALKQEREAGSRESNPGRPGDLYRELGEALDAGDDRQFRTLLHRLEDVLEGREAAIGMKKSGGERSSTTSEQVRAQPARRMSAIREAKRNQTNQRDVRGPWTQAAVSGALGKGRGGDRADV